MLSPPELLREGVGWDLHTLADNSRGFGVSTLFFRGGMQADQGKVMCPRGAVAPLHHSVAPVLSSHAAAPGAPVHGVSLLQRQGEASPARYDRVPCNRKEN